MPAIVLLLTFLACSCQAIKEQAPDLKQLGQLSQLLLAFNLQASSPVHKAIVGRGMSRVPMMSRGTNILMDAGKEDTKLKEILELCRDEESSGCDVEMLEALKTLSSKKARAIPKGRGVSAEKTDDYGLPVMSWSEDEDAKFEQIQELCRDEESSGCDVDMLEVLRALSSKKAKAIPKGQGILDVEKKDDYGLPVLSWAKEEDARFKTIQELCRDEESSGCDVDMLEVLRALSSKKAKAIPKGHGVSAEKTDDYGLPVLSWSEDEDAKFKQIQELCRDEESSGCDVDMLEALRALSSKKAKAILKGHSDSAEKTDDYGLPVLSWISNEEAKLKQLQELCRDEESSGCDVDMMEALRASSSKKAMKVSKGSLFAEKTDDYGLPILSWSEDEDAKLKQIQDLCRDEESSGCDVDMLEVLRALSSNKAMKVSKGSLFVEKTDDYGLPVLSWSEDEGAKFKQLQELCRDEESSGCDVDMLEALRALSSKKAKAIPEGHRGSAEKKDDYGLPILRWHSRSAHSTSGRHAGVVLKDQNTNDEDSSLIEMREYCLDAESTGCDVDMEKALRAHSAKKAKESKERSLKAFMKALSEARKPNLDDYGLAV